MIFGRSRPPAVEQFDVQGFKVLVENSRPDIATGDVLDRLDEALRLIDRCQPWRLNHLRRDLNQILVARFACRGAYFPGERTCLTELTFLARRDITAATVASSIVHEGIHARVDCMGVDSINRDRAKEERFHVQYVDDYGDINDAHFWLAFIRYRHETGPLPVELFAARGDQLGDAIAADAPGHQVIFVPVWRRDGNH